MTARAGTQEWFMILAKSFARGCEDQKNLDAACSRHRDRAFLSRSPRASCMSSSIRSATKPAPPSRRWCRARNRTTLQQFTLIDTATGKTVFTSNLQPAGTIDAWGQTYWTADFSTWNKPGHYAIETRDASGEAHSCAFAIEDDLLERNTLSNVLYYFKGQRASGLMDRADRHLKLPGSQSGFVDVHGGWYDATGDYGIHLPTRTRLPTSIPSRFRSPPGACSRVTPSSRRATTTTSAKLSAACWTKDSSAPTFSCA